MTFNSISHMRANLVEKFDDNFFSRQSSRFHRDKSRYWSVPSQTLTITKQDGSKVYYEPVLSETEKNLYVLRLIKEND